MATTSTKIAESANPNMLVATARDYVAIQHALAHPPKANAALKVAFVQFCKQCPESAKEFRGRIKR